MEGGGLTLAMGLSSKGIKFGGPARSLTRIVFLIVIPSAASAFYLKLLAGLAGPGYVVEALDALDAAAIADAYCAWSATLLKHVADTRALVRDALVAGITSTGTDVIDVYFINSPNGRKVSVLLEELGVQGPGGG